jgi:hypothetical protein
MVSLPPYVLGLSCLSCLPPRRLSVTTADYWDVFVTRSGGARRHNLCVGADEVATGGGGILKQQQ